MTSYGMFIAPLALVALSASVAALPTARLIQPAQLLLIAEDAPSQPRRRNIHRGCARALSGD